MKALRYFIFLALLVGLGYTASAQNYNSAIGARLGIPLSLSYKTFINENIAIEGVFGFRSRRFLGVGYTQFNVIGLAEIHNDVSSIDNLQWYFGGGAGAYFTSFSNGFNFNGEDDGAFTLGISGVVGAEYTISEAPVTLSVDWLPTFFINGFGSGFSAGYGAIGVRYILN